MRLMKWMLATALVLDAALVMTGSVNVSTSVDQSVGYATDVNPLSGLPSR